MAYFQKKADSFLISISKLISFVLLFLIIHFVNCDKPVRSVAMNPVVISFLLQALQHRKEMLLQMLLTIPSHLEYVDAYTHNGRIIDDNRHFPWRKGE